MIWWRKRHSRRPLLMPHQRSLICVESEPHECGYYERDVPSLHTGIADLDDQSQR